MSDRIVDCRGLVCPQPVIHTKKAVEETVSGKITIIVDNEVAKTNVVKFAAAHALGVAVEAKDGNYYISMIKGTGQQPKAAASLLPDAEAGGQVYLITQNTLGQGSPELGAVLMKAFMTTLLEIKPQPAALLFINSGIKLTVQDSPVLEQLRTLAGRGVSILSCGTCLDYYQHKSDLAIGEITNMYTILETISTNKTVTL
ncbi:MULTISPECIES: sulfurtransferase-like selenium metabolism protein YedF [Sporomusa]|jgi:selenium metabolism protein YedF|uniref:sulfurtransferase-like selenium metabolism protein YedF n=1 Tax=Sporomusa TaxID=2375 RepID=UPI002C1EFCC4|nr:sulfurtransferase-like selenium metabolism protein YedF [Sporomusa sphaeroides]HML35521.1 sulfurtransferase-like selenium metabolism protein YedF [Sporomusa sphaeroides]